MGAVGPRPTGTVARQVGFEFDVRHVHREIDGRFEDHVRAPEDTIEHVVSLDLRHDMLHTQTPVVENCVHVDLVSLEHTIWRLLVLDHDVVVGLEGAVAHAPLERKKGRRVLGQNVLVVHSPHVWSSVVHDGAEECDTDHQLDATVVVLAAIEHHPGKPLVLPDVLYVDVCPIEDGGEPVLEEVTAVIHFVEPLPPVDFIDNGREHAHDGDDDGVELLARYWASEWRVEDGADELIPSRVVVDVDEHQIPVSGKHVIVENNGLGERRELGGERLPVFVPGDVQDFRCVPGGV